MAVDPVTLAGPPGWVVTAFNYAIGREDRNSTVTAQIQAAREAGYSGTRQQLIAIGQGIISADAFAAQQGGGPGDANRRGPGGPPRVIAQTPPLIPVPGLPPIPGSQPPVTVPGGTPARPGGVSIPDRIPGRVSVPGGVAGAVSAVAQSILRGGWIGALFYPSSTSRTDVVCTQTQYGPWCPPGMPAVPAPGAIPAPRPGTRRRPRAVPGTSPRRRERPRTAAPAQPRGRPVTISRPQVITPPRVIDRTFPQPNSLPPPVWNPGPVTAPSPATVPAARPVTIPALAALAIPGLAAWLGTSSASQTAARTQTNALARGIVSPAIVSPVTVPQVGAIPGVGAITLPGGAVNPLAELATQTLPLTAYSAAVAQSPAQELDRKCRERAERKRKKRKPRSECWKGSYTETRKGTLKRRREKIRCR